MGFSVEDGVVRGDLFKPSGKWMYTVALDYRGVTMAEYVSRDLWIQAAVALARATRNGISGVTFTEIPDGWTLVVLEPYAKNGLPITVSAVDVRGLERKGG